MVALLQKSLQYLAEWISKERSGDGGMEICVIKNEEIINEEIIFK